MVEVDFGNDDFYEDDLISPIGGTVPSSHQKAKFDKITKDTFYGDKPQENAEIFLNTLQKSRAKHIKKV